MLSRKGSACWQQRRESMHERKAPGWTQLLGVGQQLETELKARELKIRSKSIIKRLKKQKLTSLESSQAFRHFGGLDRRREANVLLKHETDRVRCSKSEPEPKQNPWTSNQRSNKASLILRRMTIPLAHQDQTLRALTTTEAATFCPSQQA